MQLGKLANQELLDSYNWHLETIDALREIGLTKEADKFENCGRSGYVLSCPDGHQVWIRNRCDLRICLDCCERIAKRLWRKYTPVLQDTLGNSCPFYGLKLLTLTKRNTGRIKDYKQLRREFKKFFKQVRKLINKVFPKRRGCGALAVLEVTGNFTIHCHAVVHGPFVPQAELSDLWLKITGDSRVVDIRRVKCASVRKSLAYILKYIFKPCFLSRAEDYALFLGALKRVRRVHTYGKFYNYLIEEEEKPPVVCPLCGGKLLFDKDFYFEYGVLRTFSLKFDFGIEPLVA